MAAWMPGMEFVPQAVQQTQPKTWAEVSESQTQMAAMQQQYQAMWMMDPSWGYHAPAGMMAGGTPTSQSGGGPPGVMQRSPGAAAGAAATEKKGLALPVDAKQGKAQQTKDDVEKQMMESYMMAKGEPPAPPQAPEAPQPQAPTERQLMIAAVREQLMKATVRKGPPQRAGIPLRHSTFSALNLEVGARPRQSVVNRRQTLAELKESVHEMRRAQVSKQTSAEESAEASPVAVENLPDVDDSLLTADSTLDLERTRTPSSAESGEGTPTGSGHVVQSASYGAASAHEHVSDGQFARSTFLLFRSPVEAVPPELQTLSVVPDPACEPSDRALFGTGLNRGAPKLTPKARSQDMTWVPKVAISENAWKASGSTTFSRPARLRRDLKSLLNKVCPENVMIIVERMANTEIGTLEELELLISLIFEKALAEPHYCETYADMTFSLKDWMPEFHSEALGKAVNFRAALINACQHEFESLSSTLALDAEEMASLDAGEVDFQRKKRKDRVLANMKFIGQLFLREMLSAKIIGSVIQDLALCHQPEEVPEEPMVECICELLTNIGYTLELSPIGASALATVCFRLKDLQGRRIEGSKFLYSKRIQFAIQDLLDIRAAGWTKRTFKASAKTKEEIRFQQEKDIAAQARGWQVQEAEVHIAGAKPLWFNAGC